jgi:hypothetical protein
VSKIIQISWLVSFIFIISSCSIARGAAVWNAVNEINASGLSAENEMFEQRTGIKLIYVKRGLWSMQSAYKNSMIDLYFKSLMNNSLVYSVNESKNEFVQQTITEGTINIVTNNRLQNYTDYEKAILLIASTSTLALLRDSNFNKNEVPNMFFKFIGEYDAKDIPGIINAQWFKSKNITVTSDSVIIN